MLQEEMGRTGKSSKNLHPPTQNNVEQEKWEGVMEQHEAKNNKLLSYEQPRKASHRESRHREHETSADDTEKCSTEAEIGISTLTTKAAKENANRQEGLKSPSQHEKLCECENGNV